MNFIEAVKSSFLNFRIKGRASRSEYWYFQLFSLMYLFIVLPISILPFIKAKSAIPMLTMASIMLLPLLASRFFLQIRRLHDLNLSGSFWILFFILNQLVIGLFIHLYLMCKQGTKGPNRFGNDPLQNVKVVDS